MSTRRRRFATVENQAIVEKLRLPTALSMTATWCIMVYIVKFRMNVWLNIEQKRVLEQLSAKTGAPVAELIRRAIDAYLNSRKKELK